MTLQQQSYHTDRFAFGALRSEDAEMETPASFIRAAEAAVQTWEGRLQQAEEDLYAAERGPSERACTVARQDFADATRQLSLARMDLDTAWQWHRCRGTRYVASLLRAGDPRWALCPECRGVVATEWIGDAQHLVQHTPALPGEVVA